MTTAASITLFNCGNIRQCIHQLGCKIQTKIWQFDVFLKCFYEQCIEPLQPCDICKLAGAEAINSIWLLSKCYAKNHKQVPYELLQRQVFGNPVTLLNKCDQDTRAAPPPHVTSLTENCSSGQEPG